MAFGVAPLVRKPSRMRRAIEAVYRRVAKLLAIVPIRFRGVLLAVAGLWVTLGIGKAQADYLLYPAGISAIALVVLCAVCVAAGALRVRLALRSRAGGVPPELETTHPVMSELRFPRLAAWPLVDVRMAWAQPDDVAVTLERAGRQWQEVITPRARGRYTRVVRRFTVEDVFGLTAMSFRVAWEAPMRIAPASATAGMELAVGYGHGDAFSHPSGRPEGDLVEMRAYGHGDSMRHILWKTFARSRRLLVRMPERAIAPSPTTVAFLVAGPGDEPTCATARLYLERNLFGRDFVFCADGAAEPTRDTYAAVDQIIDSAAAVGDGGAALEQQAAQIDRARLASCVVFVPAVDGAWRERVVAFASRLPAPPTVIIGVDGIEPTAKRTLAARLLVRGQRELDEDSRALAGIPALRAALQAEGVRVQIIHRTTGQQW